MKNSRVKEHYDKHLGNFYSWMTGDFNARVNENAEFFKSNNITPLLNKLAVDLGSGHGIQSVALSKLGFKVIAVDFNAGLLNELKQNSDCKVETIEADITDFGSFNKYNPELIVCMGDTLTHLQDTAQVQELIRNSCNLLPEKGKIVLSFRNLSSRLENEKRFIPVKSDNNRILTCFLEYFDDYVNVNDIFYEHKDGEWILKVSSYHKLKLTKEQVSSMLEENKFSILHTELKIGMDYIIAQKI